MHNHWKFVAIVLAAIWTIWLVEGFNVVNETVTLLSRSDGSQDEDIYHFGHNFVWDTVSSNETRLLIGSFNVPADDLHKTEEHNTTKGEMFSCSINLFSTINVCNSLRSSPLLSEQLSGHSMIQWQDGSLLTCLPTQDLQCEAITYNPGFCYRSSDLGETWTPRIKSIHQECPILNVDVMFVLDGSGSIGQQNFDIVKDWVVNISKKFDLESGNVKVGVMQFSHWFRARGSGDQPMMKIEIGLGQHQTSSDFANAVKGINLQGYTTYTAHALNVTAAEFRKSARFNDKATKKVLILLTDGASHDYELLPDTADYIRSLGIVPYAIGVGDAVPEELRLIATGDVDSTESVYELSSFDDLQKIVSELQTQILKTALEGSVINSTLNSYDMEMAQVGSSATDSKIVTEEEEQKVIRYLITEDKAGDS